MYVDNMQIKKLFAINLQKILNNLHIYCVYFSVFVSWVYYIKYK